MASGNANDCNPNPTELVATQTQPPAVLQLVNINSDTNTIVPTFSGFSDVPADEITLSIDHIREQLFSLLTPEDLFKCRRLNRVWNSYSTVELQDRFEVKCTIRRGTLEKYLKLLKKHQRIFPCLPMPVFRKYSFEKETLNILSDPMLEKFLKAYGYFIRDLSLKQNKCCPSESMLPKEKDVMEQVRNLLIHSAPNLASLRMDNMDYKVDWEENCINLYQQDSRPLRTTDPEFKEIHSIPDKEKNENLKFFSFNSISGKIFELAIQLGPNLEEIQVRRDKAEDHKHFIEPLNRLGFCKDMQFSTDSSDVFKKFADLAHEGNLKLRNIFFMFEYQNHPYYNYFWGMFTDDEVDAFNKILASSWDSLETLHCRWMMSVPGLRWPNVMPNVWKIILGPLHYTLEDGLLAFPQDFSWSKTFPKLRHVEICQAVEIQGFQQLLRCFKSQCMAGMVI